MDGFFASALAAFFGGALSFLSRSDLRGFDSQEVRAVVA